MRTKSHSAAAGAVLIAVSLAGCGGGDGGGDGGGGDGDANKTITLLPGVAADSAYISFECAAREKAEELGYEVDVQAPQRFDATLQRPIIEAAIAQRPGAIIVAPTDTSALQQPLEQAKTDGIQVVLFDTTTEDPSVAVSSVATDNLGVGEAGFTAIEERHPEGGKVWVIGSAPGISTGDQRVEGFVDAAEGNPDFTYVGLEYGQDDAAKSAQLAAATLQADPDIIGIFAASYKEGQGVATAIRQAGLEDQITLVSVDADPAQVDSLRDGQFQALIAQDFEQIGIDSVEQAVNAIEGNPVEEAIETGVHIITEENVDSPESQAAIYKTEC